MTDTKMNILVVEDEEDILALLHFNLVKAGYQVEGVSCGEEALQIIAIHQFDLIVLDLMLPGIDGLEICRRLRTVDSTREIPIIMLTARGEEADIVRGLEMGANDYVTKPFSFKVLLARVKNALKYRSASHKEADQEQMSFPDLVIYPGRNLVQVAGETADLTFTEFRVLTTLARRPGWVFTRYQIVNAVRGEDYAVTDRAVDVQIAGLRKKLGVCGYYIETVRGVGYRFREGE